MSNRLPLVFSDASRADIEKLAALHTLSRFQFSNEKNRLLDSSLVSSLSLSNSHTFRETEALERHRLTRLLGSSNNFLTRSQHHPPVPPLQLLPSTDSARGRFTALNPSSMISPSMVAELMHSPDEAAAAAAAASRMRSTAWLSRNSTGAIPEHSSTMTRNHNDIVIPPRPRTRSPSMISRGGEMRASAHFVFPPSDTTTSMPSESEKTNVNCLGPASSRCSSPAEEMTEAEQQPSIRAEKVKAALRSQHQRGKKRDDLNDLERVELARTRNREHAKSTRLRKKARYEELVQSEEKLNDLLKARDLHGKRAECFQRFLSIRHDMLNGNVSSTATADKTSYNDCDSEVDLALMKDVIVDSEEFRFRVEGLASVDCCDDDSTVSALCIMRSWDEQFRSRFSESTLPVANESRSPWSTESTSTVAQVPLSSSSSSSSSFLYQVKDGTDGIAISNNGTGYARVQLVMNTTTETRSSSLSSCTRQRIVLMTALVNFHFNTAESHQMSSVVWTVIDDPFALGSSSQVAIPLSSTSSAVPGSSTTRNAEDNGSSHHCDPKLKPNSLYLTARSA